MAGKSEHVLPFNAQAVMKADSRDKPKSEWRIDGVRGLVLAVTSEGVGTYHYKYQVGVGARRKYRQVKIGRRDAVTLHNARMKAQELSLSIGSGADPVKEKSTQAQSITFQNMAEDYLANADLADNTKSGHRQAFVLDVFPVVGDIPAVEVTREDVIDICKRIEARGSMAMSERTRSCISAAYKWGLRQAFVRDNPCRDIPKRRKPVARTRTPTSEEIAALWSASDHPSVSMSRPMAIIVKLGILTGQRRIEICAARKSELHDLDGPEPTWIIPGHVNKRGKIMRGRIKNGREQRVPLSPQALALFLEAMTYAEGDLLFPADMRRVKIGTKPKFPHIGPGSVSMAIRRWRETLEIEDISIHDLRRAISTWCKNNDVSRDVRDLILNHKDTSVTGEHYENTARMERQVRAALQAWADHVWTITGQSTGAGNVVSLRA